MERGSEIRPTYFGHLGPPNLLFTGYRGSFLYSLVSCTRIFTLQIYKPIHKLIVARIVSLSPFSQKSPPDPVLGQIKVVRARGRNHTYTLTHTRALTVSNMHFNIIFQVLFSSRFLVKILHILSYISSHPPTLHDFAITLSLILSL